jgi:plasmid replication initiation protein
MVNSELTVTRTNNLVQSSYYLTLNERRLIELSIAKIKRGENVPEIIKITADEFSSAWDIPISDAYKELVSAAKKLKNREIKTLLSNDLDCDLFGVRWVDASSYQKGSGYVKIIFSQHVKPYIEQLSIPYTSYKLLDIKHLKSAHSIRLYELMMQFKSTGFRIDTVDNFKKYFGVEDKYPRWAEFNRNVISKAINEITSATNYDVTVELIRKGRSIDRIKFFFHRKNQLSLEL